MLRASHPVEAARIAEGLRTNELLRLERELEARLAPQTAVMALRQSWALEAAGKLEEARAVLQRAVADGVPLPFDLP